MLYRLSCYVSSTDYSLQSSWRSFGLGPASETSVRLEVTLDATAVAEGYWDAMVNVGIDPREPDPEYFHLIRDFDEMLRLVESEAAQCLWV